MQPSNPILSYQNESLHIGSASIEEIAETYQTPCYVYHAPTIQKNLKNYQTGADGRKLLVCYAVKANSNLAVLQLAANSGAGADIVSGGELRRARKAGIAASRMVYSGVGKTPSEIRLALQEGILLFSVESEAELKSISAIAQEMDTKAPISLRVNPDVDAGTHPYISTGLTENKFGIAHEKVVDLYKMALELPGLDVCGIGFHIGSQLTSLEGYRASAERLRGILQKLEAIGVTLRYIDCGGGLGIRYKNESPPSAKDYVQMMCRELPYPHLTLLFEPGRSIVGNAGILVGRILYHKSNNKKNFMICDAAMNDLIRPALYDGYHDVLAVRESANRNLRRADLVGPICESGDFLAKDRMLPELQEGELFVVDSCGAYGFVMSSNYNTRPRPPEILVLEDGSVHLIRKRESFDDLIRGECLLEGYP